MAVHVEVPGDFRQGELHAVQLWSENDLTSQSGVLLKHGRHVEHVVLPGNRDGVVNIYRDLTFTCKHQRHTYRSSGSGSLSK